MPSRTPLLTESDLYRSVGFELFTAGGRAADRVGLELELFVLRKDLSSGDLSPAPLRASPSDPRPSMIEWLRDIAKRYGWAFRDDPFGAVSAKAPGGGTITLEPAGQLEYSGGPFLSPREAIDDLERFVELIGEEAERGGFTIRTGGYNGWTPDAILQVEKPRYRAMSRHFASLGEYGGLMMCRTCSLQINIDFGPEPIAAERWRLANMIAPSLNAIFPNSPHLHERRAYRSFRSEIWLHADPSRTGRLFDTPDLDPIADYLRFALDARVMFVTDEEGSMENPAAPLTFRGWLRRGYEGRYPDWSDWRLHLSTLFPDVRPRGYMEIRSIDALPAGDRAVAVGLTTALMYDDDLRRAALARIESRPRRRDPAEHEHDGYRRADFETGLELFEMALPRITDPEIRAAAENYLSHIPM